MDGPYPTTRPLPKNTSIIEHALTRHDAFPGNIG